MTDITDRPQAELRGFPIRIRELTLLRRELVTPLMLRVTLGGPEHVGFESHIADEHIKLIFPDPETGELNVPTQNGDVIDWPRPLPPTRDYTVRRYDPGAGEVDIDVVVHTVGLASTWAQQAPIGSRIPVAGPPRGIHIPDEFTWQAYFGDETALPAIARRVAELPRSTRGYAVIEVQNAAEEQPLDAPEGSRCGGCTAPTGLDKHQFDVTGYWRRGAAGDEMEHHGIAHALKHLLKIDH